MPKTITVHSATEASTDDSTLGVGLVELKPFKQDGRWATVKDANGRWWRGRERRGSTEWVDVATARSYEASEAGKETRRRYEASEAGKETSHKSHAVARADRVERTTLQLSLVSPMSVAEMWQRGTDAGQQMFQWQLKVESEQEEASLLYSGIMGRLRLGGTVLASGQVTYGAGAGWGGEQNSEDSPREHHYEELEHWWHRAHTAWNAGEGGMDLEWLKANALVFAIERPAHVRVARAHRAWLETHRARPGEPADVGRLFGRARVTHRPRSNLRTELTQAPQRGGPQDSRDRPAHASVRPPPLVRL